jgi:hypothetical protein
MTAGVVGACAFVFPLVYCRRVHPVSAHPACVLRVKLFPRASHQLLRHTQSTPNLHPIYIHAIRNCVRAGVCTFQPLHIRSTFTRIAITDYCLLLAFTVCCSPQDVPTSHSTRWSPALVSTAATALHLSRSSCSEQEKRQTWGQPPPKQPACYRPGTGTGSASRRRIHLRALPAWPA